MLGIASHRVAALDGEAFHKSHDRVVENYAFGELRSRRLHREVVQECLFLFARKKFEEAHNRLQQDTRVAVFQVGPRQEIGTDHLQAISTGSLSSQHQGCCLKRLVNYWTFEVAGHTKVQRSVTNYLEVTLGKIWERDDARRRSNPEKNLHKQ